MIIGLTGSIASGKSTVSTMLKEKDFRLLMLTKLPDKLLNRKSRVTRN